MDNQQAIINLPVTGVSVRTLVCVREQQRGLLTVGTFLNDVPFTPARFFFIHGVPANEVRGRHAHRTCEQFLVCMRGSVRVTVDDGLRREQVLLNHPNKGLYVPAGIWGEQEDYSYDAVLLVFASHQYDPDDYIRDYEEFQRFRGEPR